MTVRLALYFLLVFLSNFAFAEIAQIKLSCVGKISESSEIKPMNPDDVHSFFVVVRPNSNLIHVYRDIESESTLFDVYSSIVRINENQIVGVGLKASFEVNRFTGRFVITHSIDEIKKTVIYAGACSKLSSTPARKF